MANMFGDSKYIEKRIGFIGGGNMAYAICEGMIRKGLISYTQVFVSSPHETTLEPWKNRGAKTSTCNGTIADEADVIFLSVKPHIFPKAASEMLQTCNSSKAINKLFISVMAGVKLEVIEHILSDLKGARVVRVMPNTPLLVGEGCTAYCPGKYANKSDSELVQSVFEVSGITETIPEKIMDSICALAASGPAYIYLVIEALSDGGVKLGIPRQIANRFAAQTVLGAAKMVLETGKHPSILKEEVSSPGGTTIAGLHALEKGSVRAAFMNAVEAAALRAAELGKKE